MNSHLRAIFFLLAISLLAGSAFADPITIGLPANSANSFPFGEVTGPAATYPCTRYQQVYSSSEFASALSIGLIEFFQTELPGGNLNSGTYTFSLSTTSAAVNGLDTVNFDNNFGSDQHSFGIFVLSGGAAPSILSFSGTPYYYDPTLGNLLLDIQIAGISHSGANAYYDARANAGGIFSRAHDFGVMFDNFGLVTRFSSVPEPSTLLFLGLGLAGVGVLRKRR